MRGQTLFVNGQLADRQSAFKRMWPPRHLPPQKGYSVFSPRTAVLGIWMCSKKSLP